MRPLRGPGPAGRLHEPVVVLLPRLPAGATRAVRISGAARLTARARGVTLEDGPHVGAVNRIPEGFYYMAKALLVTFHSDQRTAAHLLSENTRLRVRVRDLEELIARLQDENDRLAQAAAVALLDLQPEELKEMQPV